MKIQVKYQVLLIGRQEFKGREVYMLKKDKGANGVVVVAVSKERKP